MSIKDKIKLNGFLISDSFIKYKVNDIFVVPMGDAIAWLEFGRMNGLNIKIETVYPNIEVTILE